MGRIEGQLSIPRKPVFAVIELGATQYKVSPGDLVVTEKLRYVDVNQQIKISRVLMLGSRYESVIGRPLVPGAYVTAAIEEQFQDAKVLIFKKRRRKNSRRLTGHRQDLTSVRIIDIAGIEAEPTLKLSDTTTVQQEAKAA
ncbi:g776 [Coccomyxa viridis]|uniref:Large ribosomal subunit protein bL21m n=1 Tax=Coccomyxa viridis TaxID=1274662 RepID=A0ABP1FKG5_9CHLO